MASLKYSKFYFLSIFLCCCWSAKVELSHSSTELFTATENFLIIPQILVEKFLRT